MCVWGGGHAPSRILIMVLGGRNSCPAQVGDLRVDVFELARTPLFNSYVGRKCAVCTMYQLLRVHIQYAYVHVHVYV